MPFAVRVGFVILAHLFVLVKYFFKLFFEALSNFLSRTRLCCFVSFATTLIFYQSLSGLSSTFFKSFSDLSFRSFQIFKHPTHSLHRRQTALLGYQNTPEMSSIFSSFFEFFVRSTFCMVFRTIFSVFSSFALL